jgi:hypothetical protein
MPSKVLNIDSPYLTLFSENSWLHVPQSIWLPMLSFHSPL